MNSDHQLHDARIPRAAHGSEAVDVVDGAVRFEVQVGRRRIRQAGEIERGIDAAELGVVEHVEGVGPELRRLPSRRARLFWSGRFVLLTPGVRR